MFRIIKKLLGENRFALIAFLFSLLDIGYYFLLISLNIEQKQALYESVTSLVLISFFSFILQRIHTYYHSRSAINIVHISIIFIFSLLSTLFLQKYGSWIGTDTPVYLTFLNSSFYIRWVILFLIFLTVVNQLWIDKHLTEQTNAFNRLIEKERQLAKSEITNLHQQFQPHFLFNSLNSISALIKSQPDDARNMIHNLSDYLRLTIQKSQDDFITIKDELDYLNLYLSIEKIRFGHRLSIEIDVEDDCKEMLLPSLLLQPIVENAIKYGLYGNIGDLIISINITSDNNSLQVIVTNPYDENTVSSSKGTGYGLESINRKLSFLYRRNDLLKIIKYQNQFSAQLLIPQK